MGVGGELKLSFDPDDHFFSQADDALSFKLNNS